jgi:hypothetical protein
MQQLINQLYESTRTPLETFEQNMTRMWEAVAAQGTGTGASRIPEIEGGMDTVRRAILEYAESAAQSLRGLGENGTAQLEELRGRLESMGQRLLASGVVPDIETWTAQVNEALSRGTQGMQSFWDAFRQGLGLGGDNPQSFSATVGQGMGSAISNAFGNLFNLFDKVAEGSMTAAEALKKFALDFVKAIAQMVAQAAALRMIQSLLGSLGFPAMGGGASPWMGGPKMAGGAVAGGYSYVVGERGPELFSPNSGGRIIPNSALGGGGMTVVVNNNAPGVVVEQRQVDERTVEIAVAIAREQSAQDFAQSMRTGFGSYAEPLNKSYALRRRF